MEEKEIKTRLQSIERSIVAFEKSIERRRDSVTQRFPAPFIFLSTFGVVCIFYGLEKIIDATPFITQNPYLLVIGGASILIATGAFYKKLQ